MKNQQCGANCRNLLQWTKTPPIEAGFYFYRNVFGCVQILHVFEGQLAACRERPGEWAGPIPEPGEIEEAPNA